MATTIQTTFEKLPTDAMMIGVSWENEAECDFLIREALDSNETIYIVREYHYGPEGQFEQWSDTYFYATAD